MPTTIKYSDNPNEETAFVTQDGGQKNRAVLTAAINGTIEYPDNPNSTKVMVTVDGVKHRAVAVADISGGGGDQHDLGYYADLTALQTAHPTGTDGDFAILGSTDTIWVWDSETSAWKDTDTKGQVTSVNGQTGAVTVDTLPTQTGNSGKFLTTDGTAASWAAISALQNTATGNQALTINGTACTYEASVNIGNSSQADEKYSVAIGYNAKAWWQHGTALGYGAVSNKANATAIGDSANANGQYAIQLGVGTNSNANTLSVGLASGSNYQLLSSNGTIPTARLTKANTTVTLAVADWSSNTQTVSVTGVTATSIVLVAPDPSDTADYVAAGILCTSQATNSLTFTATTTPTNDIDVNIVCL